MKTAAIASTNDNAGSSKNVKKEKKSNPRSKMKKAQDIQEEAMGTHQTNGLINRRGGGHWAANHSLTPGFF